VLDLDLMPIVPLSPTVSNPGTTTVLSTKSKGIEKLLRRLKGLCGIFSRFEKLDVFFLDFAPIVEAFR